MKTFTKEDIIKKHQTNIKSASSGFSLAGILGIIYIVRYFITGNLNFYFSLTFTEMMLRLHEKEMLPLVASVAIIAVFLVIYITAIVLVSKDAKYLKVALGIYLFDTLCFIGTFLLRGDNLQSDFFIDVIVHTFVILFILVGIRSAKAVDGK